jgi:y4mF family transcriptional regulator
MSDEMNDRTHPLAAAARARREDLGLRQIDVADLAGVSLRFVHMLEAGKPTVRLDKVLDVLRVLGLELRVCRGTAAIIDESDVST